MIYNLREYLEGESGLNIRSNPKDLIGGETQVPDAIVQVIEEGGTSTAWFKFHTYTIQVIARNVDDPSARFDAYVIYNLLDNKFGLVLPQVTVKGLIYQAMPIAQISANTEPQFLGYDENGRTEYSNTYRFLV